jgi:Phage tail tube protein, GTA-gp10
MSAAAGEARANPARGEAQLRLGALTLTLRPSFAALVAAEAETGPLFALVERAAQGQLGLAEMIALFWHCRAEPPPDLTRDGLGEAVAAAGLAAVTPALRQLLGQILGGR